LKFPILLLDNISRKSCDEVIGKHCEIRNWKLWAVNARTTHVHVVVTAIAYKGNIVRDQLKANCTRSIREVVAKFRDRPLWTEGGDWSCINAEDELHDVIEYVREAQDRKGCE